LCLLLLLYDRHDLTIWGRMHSDAQFAGSSSVPAHVEMMGLIGMGNNPQVGTSVVVAVVGIFVAPEWANDRSRSLMQLKMN